MQFQERAGGYSCQKTVQNPHASAPLVIPFAVLRNTTRTRMDENIRTNSARDVPWLTVSPAHEGVAVLVGGGASVENHLDEIKALQADGALVFAMNGASRWLHTRGVTHDGQIMVDARPDSRHLLDRDAKRHFLASQVDPWLFDHANHPTLFHIGMDGIEELLPEDRRYDAPMLGGGASVGMTAMCLAHVVGFRTIHCFGYDSSHEAGRSHAYPQPMNDVIPTLETTWAGKVYTST